METRKLVEHYEEECIYCGKSMMYYVPFIIKEVEGEYEVTKHAFEIRQCSFCKMIQPQED